MRRFSKYISLAATVLMVFAMLTACGGEVAETQTLPGTNEDTAGDAAGDEVSSSFGGDSGDVSGDAAAQTEPEVQVDTDPQFDGVYLSGDNMIVIRYADEEICDLIISMGVDGANAYVSGIGQISGNDVLFQTEVLAVTMNLNFDELVVTEEGTNTYYDGGFAGTYTRSDTDPYSVQIRQTSGSGEGIGTVSTTIINGERAVLYVDPDDLFTATVPDIFTEPDEDKRPENGIYFGSIDNDVYAIIERTEEGGITPEQLKEDMETEYGVEADLFVNGMVTVQYTYTDTATGQEWTCVIYAIVIDTELVRVEYGYLSAHADYYGSLLDQVSINLS